MQLNFKSTQYLQERTKKTLGEKPPEFTSAADKEAKIAVTSSFPTWKEFNFAPRRSHVKIVKVVLRTRRVKFQIRLISVLTDSHLPLVAKTHNSN